MKNYQKLIILLTCISLIISIIFIIQTYAKYSTAVDGTATMSIARWNIKVNDEYIENNDDISEVLEVTFEGSNYIAEDVIAPGAIRIFRSRF